jgi:hypothetical protein
MATMLGMNANTNNRNYGKNHSSSPLSTPLWHIFQKESSQCKYWYNGPDKSVDDDDTTYLDEAKKFMETNMDLVCFLTDLDGCLRRVRTLMGLPEKDFPTIPHMNASPLKQQQGAMHNSGEDILVGKIIQTNALRTGVSQMGGRNETPDRGDNIHLSPHDRAMQDPAIRDLVASVNGADIALYDWAIQRYQR